MAMHDAVLQDLWLHTLIYKGKETDNLPLSLVVWEHHCYAPGKMLVKCACGSITQFGALYSLGCHIQRYILMKMLAWSAELPRPVPNVLRFWTNIFQLSLPQLTR